MLQHAGGSFFGPRRTKGPHGRIEACLREPGLPVLWTSMFGTLWFCNVLHLPHEVSWDFRSIIWKAQTWRTNGMLAGMSETYLPHRRRNDVGVWDDLSPTSLKLVTPGEHPRPKQCSVHSGCHFTNDAPHGICCEFLARSIYEWSIITVHSCSMGWLKCF